jgi:hypothetical protein
MRPYIQKLVRVAGIEPATSLSQARPSAGDLHPDTTIQLVGAEGFEPPQLPQRFYRPPPSPIGEHAHVARITARASVRSSAHPSYSRSACEQPDRPQTPSAFVAGPFAARKAWRTGSTRSGSRRSSAGRAGRFPRCAPFRGPTPQYASSGVTEGNRTPVCRFTAGCTHHCATITISPVATIAILAGTKTTPSRFDRAVFMCANRKP